MMEILDRLMSVAFTLGPSFGQQACMDAIEMIQRQQKEIETLRKKNARLFEKTQEKAE